MGVNALDQLREMAAVIDSRADWWRFPKEGAVQGFMGMGRLFIVGDQPSTSPWEYWHPNRRAFYDLLPRVGAADAHLTDLYKRRGRSGTLRNGIPADFSDHVEFFRKELALLRATRVVALGHHAYWLLSRHVPEVRPMLGRMWHFAYVVRYNKLAFYESNMRVAFNADSQWRSNIAQQAVVKTGLRESLDSHCKGQDMKNRNLCLAVHDALHGARIRRWTLRDDNNSHHHGVVRLSESPFYLELSWRRTAIDPAQRVGTFRLNLPDLLRGGYIRPDPADSLGTDVRLRIVRSDDGSFYVQANHDGPRVLLAVAGEAAV